MLHIAVMVLVESLHQAWGIHWAQCPHHYQDLLHVAVTVWVESLHWTWGIHQAWHSLHYWHLVHVVVKMMWLWHQELSSGISERKLVII